MPVRAVKERALRIVDEPVHLPALMTVAEAADFLRIGRTLAYQLAQEYLASGGTSGLPVLRFGTCLRVPRWALIELATTGRVVRLGQVADAVLPSAARGTARARRVRLVRPIAIAAKG